jgi:hypothetical protein
MRSFDEGAFCCDGDEEGWEAYVNGGLVFAVAKVAKLWSAEKFLFGHIENKLMFRESQPYHSQTLKLGNNFEIYLQAFRVCNEDNFLQEAEVLYLELCLKKKRSPEWDSMLSMFTASSSNSSTLMTRENLEHQRAASLDR